ncbi:hypothetical protein LshimejAT787_0904420 [Lyophyllum shimeji]|uniref:Uncharacterized protein n=1 Tax=Lyophyllum shimeji TaxID=47721 RepID=A0A9P3PR78_LYOSH|nr:hypothetical protein LshimejAT787_0904420 [Lyophyllum shimeji]
MPSFRTVFAVAATAFAALTSAAPIDTPALPGALTGAINNVPVKADTVTSNLPDINGLPGLSGLTGITGGVTNGVNVPNTPAPLRRDGQLQSLPEILNDLQAKLTTVSDKLTTVVGVKAVVDVQVVLPIIEEVKGIVFTAVGSVQAIANHPQDFVLALQGKVLSVPEVAHLLCTVMTILATILASAGRVVGAASAQAVAPAVAGVGAVVFELLSAIFALVAGLLAVVVPIAGPIITTFQGLNGFSGVVGLLKL